MSRRWSRSRLTLWLLAWTLVLRAAVPLFAASAAEVRGVPLAEVCTLYGVALAKADPSDGADRDTGSQTSHDDGHCALTALQALAAGWTPAIVAVAALPRPTGATRRARDAFHDACAAWAARHKQGPPAAA